MARDVEPVVDAVRLRSPRDLLGGHRSGSLDAAPICWSLSPGANRTPGKQRGGGQREREAPRNRQPPVLTSSHHFSPPETTARPYCFTSWDRRGRFMPRSAAARVMFPLVFGERAGDAIALDLTLHVGERHRPWRTCSVRDRGGAGFAGGERARRLGLARVASRRASVARGSTRRERRRGQRCSSVIGGSRMPAPCRDGAQVVDVVVRSAARDHARRRRRAPRRGARSRARARCPASGGAREQLERVGARALRRLAALGGDAREEVLGDARQVAEALRGAAGTSS